MCSDWLSEQARRAYLAARDFPFCSHKSEILWAYNKSFVDQLVLTPTLSRSIKTQKENVANIQPSCAWSITHMYFQLYYYYRDRLTTKGANK